MSGWQVSLICTERAAISGNFCPPRLQRGYCWSYSAGNLDQMKMSVLRQPLTVIIPAFMTVFHTEKESTQTSAPYKLRDTCCDWKCTWPSLLNDFNSFDYYKLFCYIVDWYCSICLSLYNFPAIKESPVKYTYNNAVPMLQKQQNRPKLYFWTILYWFNWDTSTLWITFYFQQTTVLATEFRLKPGLENCFAVTNGKKYQEENVRTVARLMTLQVNHLRRTPWDRDWPRWSHLHSLICHQANSTGMT